ncbi:MAG TPA: hypothetical protein VHX14_21025 [Thermoanaerobaculia bacterium]|nr:hypothetical protein [Thermoanaerobaculia bacterium]
MSPAKHEADVAITLTRDEALVLFELLTRFSDGPEELRIDDQSEQRVLWDMLCQLERTLHEPINNPHYEERLEEARFAVRGKI